MPPVGPPVLTTVGIEEVDEVTEEVLLEAVDLVLRVTGTVVDVDLDVGVVLKLVLELTLVIDCVLVEVEASEVGTSVPAVFSKHLQALLTRSALMSAKSLGRAMVGEARYFGQNAAASEEKRSKARRALSSKQTTARLPWWGKADTLVNVTPSARTAEESNMKCMLVESGQEKDQIYHKKGSIS